MKFSPHLHTLAPKAHVCLPSSVDAFKSVSEAPGSVPVSVYSEAEIANTSDPLLVTLRKVYDELKPGRVYFAEHNGSAHGCYFLQKEVTKKLDGNAAGKAHLASVAGGALSAALQANLALEKRSSVAVTLTQTAREQLAGVGEYFLLAVMQRGYSNKAFRNESSEKSKQTLSIHFSPSDFSASERSRALALSESMLLTRSLINMPPNLLRPDSYERIVHETYSEVPNVSIEVLDSTTLLELGCNLICAVGQGSQVPSRIVKLTYTPKAAAKKHIALVGKGITFDTGGLDIKASNFMRNMKKDMGGSAAALGIFNALAALGIEAKISCYLALAENMVSGSAMRPSDVYKARNGVQVEIDNTDAEGRLVLADALCLVAEKKPDWIIDLATLTGAARIALGPMVDALFCNNPKLAQLVSETGTEIGDWFWQLPLVDDYDAMLDSQVADCMNSASSGLGGAVTAALFLRKFVSDIPWTHIDTFMWAEKAGDLVSEAGASAKCVRAVSKAIEKFVNG